MSLQLIASNEFGTRNLKWGGMGSDKPSLSNHLQDLSSRPCSGTNTKMKMEEVKEFSLLHHESQCRVVGDDLVSI